MNNYIGKDGFNWWLGVIEAVDDPLSLGRCRVRIFGWHTSNKKLIPTENLPWALPINSPNSSMTAAAPVIGDYAFGFFSDGISGQAPFLIGIFPGIPQNGKNDSLGFSEGDHYPVGEPTTSRLYRNDEFFNKTCVYYNDNNLDTGVPTADGSSWSEPKSGYATTPASNRVIETKSGHVFEMDDTPGAERIHLNHKANTFFQIDASGNMVTKVSGKNYEVYLSDNNIHVKGVCNITVDGNANIYVKGNVTEKVDGNIERTVGGNVTETIGGNYQAQVSGTYQVTSGGNMTLIAPKIDLNP
jgi:hypothetical protein